MDYFTHNMGKFTQSLHILCNNYVIHDMGKDLHNIWANIHNIWIDLLNYYGDRVTIQYR